MFSAVFLVGNALGSMVFGYVAHGLGYRVMWSTLTLLLAPASSSRSGSGRPRVTARRAI